MDLHSMAQLLGNLGEFVGAIAVVVTLAYLAVQVRHSKEATEANTRLAEQSHRLALVENQIARVELIERQMRDLSSSSDLAEIFEKYDREGIGALSPVERRRFQSWHIIQHYVLDSQHYQHELAMLDEESWQDAVRRIKAQIPVWDQLDMRIIGRSPFVDEIRRLRDA
jgi:hypothetical protein